MKKVLSVILIAGLFAFASCAPGTTTTGTPSDSDDQMNTPQTDTTTTR